MTDIASLPLLLEPEQLAPHLDNPKLLIIDLCSGENYLRHHLPGARYLPPTTLLCGIPPAAGKLPDISRLEAIFSTLGLSNDHHVVVYDDEGSGWAGRMIWTLDMLGHNSASVLNGGIHAWLSAELPTEEGQQRFPASEYRASLNREPRIELDELVSLIGSEELAIWDARSPEEYEGTRAVSARGGHIPGAVNMNWLDVMDRQRDLRMIDLDELRSRLAEMGITPDKRVVTHCQSHHRSGLTYLALKALGFPNFQAYDGSWSEWGNRSDTPIVIGHEPH